MDKSSWTSWIDAALMPFIPPCLLGAFIGSVYAKNQPLYLRLISFVISSGLSVYGTAAIAENIHLGPQTLAIVAILAAVIGTDLIEGVIMVSRKFKTDPAGTAREWLNLWRGKDS